MKIAFFLIAIACFAFVLAAWPYVHPFGLVLLAIVGLGFAGAGIFTTDPAFIGEGGKTTNGKLHVLFAFLVIFLFPAMATVVSISLSSSALWSNVQSWLFWIVVTIWLSLVTFIVTSGIRTQNEHAPVGYAERFLVAAFSLWLLVVSIAAIV